MVKQAGGAPRDEARADPGPPPVPVADPPPLANASLAGRALYETARSCLAELERVAPWHLLYHPPDDLAELAPRLGEMATIIAGLGDRMAPALALCREAAASGEPAPAGDDVAFALAGIDEMVQHELGLLRDLIGPEGEGRLRGANRERLTEVSADLKGKFASSLMSATAYLVCPGASSGFEVEEQLFPERAEEFRLTSALAAALPEVLAQLRRAADPALFQDLLTRWRLGLRADPYALSDLVTLRGQLGSLLIGERRRAFYTGDYFQVRQREGLLAARLGELERLHRESWGRTEREAAVQLRSHRTRLENLLFGVAAVLDTQLLRALVGEAQIAALRRTPVPFQPGADAEEWAPLVAQDDLRLFLEMLFGAVRRRSSLARPAPSGRVRGAAAAASEPDLVPAQATAAEIRAAIDRVRSLLTGPLAAGSPGWRSFRLFQQLLGKRTRIPETMLEAVRPAVVRVQAELLPSLRLSARELGVTAAVLTQIEASCTALLVPAPSPGELQSLFPPHLARLSSFVEALRGTLARRR